ncbi:MAG: hypothetical protein WAV38_34780, partial [Xanthobacteraceae bacterium]
EFRTTAVGAHGETFEFERKFQRIADGLIVIDHGDKRYRRYQFPLRHDALRAFDRTDVNLSAAILMHQPRLRFDMGQSVMQPGDG